MIMNIQRDPQDCDIQSKKIHEEQLALKWKLLFYVLAITVHVALLIKLPLFILQQLSSRVFLPQACPDTNVNNETISQQYVFTMVVYSCLYIGRWFEVLVIHIHIYKFFFSQTTLQPKEFKQLCKEGLAKKKKRALFFIVALYMLLHSLLIPILGISLEIRQGQQTNCKSYIYEYHTVYWILDVIRYLHDVAIRLLMFLATLAIGVIWSKESKSKTDNNSTLDREPESYVEYLEDRELSNEDHKTRMTEYAQRGREVERILEIFQTWFMIPWVLYFIGSSLDAEHILQSWRDGSTGDAEYDFAEVTYMVYNFNQLFFLTLAYLCSGIINTQHYNYFRKSRLEQLAKYSTASKMALASMNKIEKEDHFDFVPRIWGTSIKIHVDSPLYVLFLLISIFFTVMEGLI